MQKIIFAVDTTLFNKGINFNEIRQNMTMDRKRIYAWLKFNKALIKYI